jgi:glycosyltransferase involved in cell wall biosynthesis
MRVVIDLQGAQGGNRDHGIGRCALALSQGIVRNCGSHDVRIVLSDLFPETIEPLRGAFASLLPGENVHVWCAEAGVAKNNSSNDFRRCVAEAQREAFIASLRPDMAIVTSLFEGFGDDVVTSVNEYSSVPTAVVFHDLIPFIYKDLYLTDPRVASWYYEKLVQLKQADLFLANSESSRLEGISLLDIDSDRIVNISAGSDSRFAPRKPTAVDLEYLRKQYRLARDFVMYTGGIDQRKNIEGLIRSFAKLPGGLRRAHQLAIVWAAQPDERSRLERCASEAGLGRDELVVTGIVPDDDLLTLYTCCKAFVFPSLHEGFGLPALEAMQCGKAVIASDTSSLPEVVGRPDALFNPRDDSAIAAAIERVLKDDAFRRDLERHGPIQAAKFNWDKTAERAIRAIETVIGKQRSAKAILEVGARKRLAYVSPLPPERTGIADYSAELLPFLISFYKIDVIVNQPRVCDDWIVANCRQRTVQWFRENYREYDRVLYHFGNSSFHEYMFDLLELVSGIVVLHDFSLSGIMAYRGLNTFLLALKESHGYHAVLKSRTISAEAAVYAYPANICVLQSSIGVIVHSDNSLTLVDHWYGAGSGDDFAVIPHLRVLPTPNVEQRNEARNQLGLTENEVLICSFGILGPMKLNDRLLNAFFNSKLAGDHDVRLVFVGKNDEGEYGDKLLKLIAQHSLDERVQITGWVSRDDFTKYLNAADIAVQLRGLSRGESSGAVLDCMSHGLVTVINSNGALADINRDAVWMLDDRFGEGKLIEALECLTEDKALRKRIGSRARETVQRCNSPTHCAALYFEAIETFYGLQLNELGGLFRRLSLARPYEADAQSLASTLARNFPPRPRLRQLLVDVSELVLRDSRSGIQRVVRSILSCWLLDPPKDWTVEPIYATSDRLGYRYARRLACEFLNIDTSWSKDEEVDAWASDVFLGIDLQPCVIPAQREVLSRWHRAGVDVRFVVHDLLPVLLPSCFHEGSAETYTNWLTTVASFSGAVCVSQTVADELHRWCKSYAAPRSVPFEISWFHLGADIRQSNPSAGMPDDAERVLGRMRGKTTFLMVGTVEPRKGHRQALAAFEILWKSGLDVDLVIVGRQGWMVEEVVEQVRGHPEFGVRLLWPENVSDEFLERIYSASTCLLAPSEGEGFGLPLVEGAQHGLPIIARDLPVFKEVAGDHAFYFGGLEPQSLASAVADWLKLYEMNTHPPSTGIKWLTWAESADMLLSRLGIEIPRRSP